MRFVICPLYQEAAPLIERMQLRPAGTCVRHPVYEGEDIRLFLCGYGSLEAAASVSAFLGQSAAKERDWYFLYGSAAGITRDDGIYQLNRIRSLDSGRDYYPSLYLDLPSASVTCGSTVLKDNREGISSDLYDMESDGILQAFSLYADDSHRLLLRFVSDTGKGEISPKMLQDVSSSYAGTFIDAMDALVPLVTSVESSILWTKEDQRLEDQLADHLHASITMRRRLHQLLIYARASHQDLSSFENLQAKDRAEGKEMLHELSDRLAAKI